MQALDSNALSGVSIVITRPAATAAALVRAVQRAGGNALRLPGMSLRPAPNPQAVFGQLHTAGDADVWIVTSPAAVRFLWRLAPDLHAPGQITVFAVGRGTARALARRGILAIAPAHGNEGIAGVLALPQLKSLRGKTVVVIGAPGGRDPSAELARRGASATRLDVYQRLPAPLTSAQVAAIVAAKDPFVTLLTSAEILGNLTAQLPAKALHRMQAAALIVASDRLRKVAAAAGFTRIAVAASPAPRDLVAAAASAVSNRKLASFAE